MQDLYRAQLQRDTTDAPEERQSERVMPVFHCVEDAGTCSQEDAMAETDITTFCFSTCSDPYFV